MADAKSGGAEYATDFVKSDYDKAIITDSVHTDNLMTALLNVTAEVWVIRRRLMITEALAAQKVVATSAAIDAFTPTPQQTAAWESERNTFIDRTLSALTRPGVKIETSQMPLTRNSAPLRTV